MEIGSRPLPHWKGQNVGGLVHPGGGSASGNWNGTGGNPLGSIEIVLTGATGGATAENTYSGFWEQPFTTGFIPTGSEMVLDWSCLGIGTGDRNMIAYAFIDTASGPPSVGTEVWTSGPISSTTSWTTVGPIDTSGIVNADDTYYLKVAFRDNDLGKNEGTRIVGFDNVMVSYSTIAPVFYMEYDFEDTGSSVRPTIGSGVPPITFDIPVSLGWNFISYQLDVSGLATTVFDDNGGDTTWTAIQWYDPTDTGNHWKSFDKSYPWGQTLPNIDNTMGLWINIDDVGSDGFLTIEGYAPVSTSITLIAGWNMVGYPSNTPDTATNVLAGTGYDLLQKFDAGAPYRIIDMLGSENMVAGQAYWVHVPADTSYIVTY